MIIIESYTSKWPEEFRDIHRALSRILGASALAVDHIGSTSIPGLGAKDIIDVQITVAALLPELRESLVRAGYRWLPDVDHDHVPAGEDPDTALWTKWFFRQPVDARRANIHMRIKGHPNQRYPLLFRDYLRAHPNSARSIELIKREIARRHGNDEEAYYDIKDPVYDLVWEAAREWAVHTGWRVS